MTTKTVKAGLAITLFLLGTSAFAQQTKTVDAGVTTVQLSSTFVGALTSLKVTPGTVSPTHIYNGTADFPIGRPLWNHPAQAAVRLLPLPERNSGDSGPRCRSSPECRL
jgi:hypothetical protein